MVAMQPLTPVYIDSAAAAPLTWQKVHGQGGLTVSSQDEQILGKVAEFINGSTGDLSGFTVRSGSAQGGDVRIPINWIHSVNRDQILLRVPAAEALATDLSNRRLSGRRRR